MHFSFLKKPEPEPTAPKDTVKTSRVTKDVPWLINALLGTSEDTRELFKRLNWKELATGWTAEVNTLAGEVKISVSAKENSEAPTLTFQIPRLSTYNYPLPGEHFRLSSLATLVGKCHEEAVKAHGEDESFNPSLVVEIVKPRVETLGNQASLNFTELTPTSAALDFILGVIKRSHTGTDAHPRTQALFRGILAVQEMRGGQRRTIDLVDPSTVLRQPAESA